MVRHARERLAHLVSLKMTSIAIELADGDPWRPILLLR
jgi:hypothetical protein